MRLGWSSGRWLIGEHDELPAATHGNRRCSSLMARGICGGWRLGCCNLIRGRAGALLPAPFSAWQGLAAPRDECKLDLDCSTKIFDTPSSPGCAVRVTTHLLLRYTFSFTEPPGTSHSPCCLALLGSHRESTISRGMALNAGTTSSHTTSRDDADGDTPSSKRRRLDSSPNDEVAFSQKPASRRKAACQSCRIRKVKCDAVRPTCGICKACDTTCQYTDPLSDKLT